MSSTCFEREGSSSGRRLFIQVWSTMFYMHQYKQYNRLLRLMHITYHTFIYNRLPEEEPSDSKYAEDIIN